MLKGTVPLLVVVTMLWLGLLLPLAEGGGAEARSPPCSSVSIVRLSLLDILTILISALAVHTRLESAVSCS